MRGLTDEEVEREIERLTGCDAVKLARAEQRILYKRRQYMYQLRRMEKRGHELMEMGVSEESLPEYLGLSEEEEC